MNIKNKLYISAGISIVLVVALVSVVLVTSGRIAEENEKHQLLMDVHESVSELDIVTYDYLLHHEKRMEHQWNIKHDSLGEILDGLAEEEGLLPIRADYAALGNLFSQVTANNEKIQKLTQEGASQEKIDAAIGLEERLVAQLLITSHSIIADASRLAEEAHTEVMEAQRLASSLTVILMIVLATAITTSSLLIARSISKPLDELTKGAEIIGKGELEHKVEVKSKDELGQLAAAFNNMTESLKETTASRDDLDREVTIRKQSEEKLAKSEAILNEAQHIANIGSWELDLISNTLTWSDEVYRIFEVEPQQFRVTYEAFLDSIHPDDREMVNKSYTESLSNITPYSIVHRLLLKDGTVKYVNEKCQTLYDDEKPIRSIGTVQDITERKRAEEDMRKYAEQLKQANIHLQEMDSLKSVFLASMSHELRTPLNSIIGYTGLILMGVVGEINQEQREQLAVVKRNANHLLSLINDILDISRIEAGKVELSLEEFSLDEVVREVVESVSPTVTEKSLEFVTEVPEGITLFSDKRRMKQILINLVSNAVKFTDQGSVKIAARIPGDDNLEIRVVDTGIGIKKEDVYKLFQSFQQVGISLTKKHEGTGLGLYLTKKLTDLLGGNISAKSEYGRGSEFTFTLPLEYREEQK